MTPTTPTAALGGSVEAFKELLDVIHAGRFVPLANSEGLCKSVLDNAENALTALLASAAGGENDSDRSLWALEKAREIANQICSDSSPPTFRAKLIDLVMGALYTSPPPPVGELQGVSDETFEELWTLFSQHMANFNANRDNTETRAKIDKVIAASRPVARAGPVSQPQPPMRHISGVSVDVLRRAALTPVVAAPQAAVEAEMEDLTPDEVEAILRALEVDHKPSDYEPECPGCTAYQKIAAIRAEQKG